MAEEVIRFSRETPWSCPAYKDFYIKDRPDGKGNYSRRARYPELCKGHREGSML